MVGGSVFLLVPAHPGSTGQKRAVKRSLLLSMLLRHGLSHQLIPQNSRHLRWGAIGRHWKFIGKTN